jgi:hypothetical protein
MDSTAFRCFWLARGLAGLAGQVQSVTIGWQIYRLGRASLDVDQ